MNIQRTSWEFYNLFSKGGGGEVQGLSTMFALGGGGGPRLTFGFSTM